MPTPQETVANIREAVVEVEEAMKKLHRRLHRGLADHADLLGIEEEEAQTLAGGGTPKQPPERP